MLVKKQDIIDLYIIKSKNGRRKAAVFGFRSFEINVKNVDCNFNKL